MDCKRSASASDDIWKTWLLERRARGDRALLERALTGVLYPIRDRVLNNAALQEGETLLDVGCGDGLLAFGALARTQTGRVIFSDISQLLLDHAAELAKQMGVVNRCNFVAAPADDLSILADDSVDVVTTRSVLIYVADKARALAEFYRVLRPGGRISLFEPINRFRRAQSRHRFVGFDVTPIMDITDKLKAVYEALQPSDTDPMLNFDERDLVQLAEAAGFNKVRLELTIEIGNDHGELRTWDDLLHVAFNPKVPTLAEAMAQVLSDEEQAALVAYLRPLVEAGAGQSRSAVAYLWAKKA